ncbi:hypothetical protein AT278_04760 [Bacillus cereus]|uniref:restriction endonuclease subunit S n=1 Tax=Bacillus TaxID=1386 RepID=UPI00077A3222|nr:restriction endonuclease subunit S [Bacillus cereus]KXY54628.1 hypothetical protein AT278_04760 [Bacillus cereus]
MDAKQLKDSILQYAMQGKLVPQDPNDEPAIELLKRIKGEKEQLIAQKVIKKEKALPEISEQEIPFEIPETWEWCRIKNVYYNIGQKKPDKKFTYIDVAAIDNKNGVLKEELSEIESANAPSRARKVLTKGDVIYATVRPYLKNIAVIDREFANEPIASTAFVVMTPIQIEVDFLYYVLVSPMFDTQVASKVQGVTYPAINDANFNNLVIPVPPKNEQKRIVEQIKKLQSMVSFYGEKQARLNQIQNEFPVKLEKSILQYAMQGNLLEQDSTNEPASKLIERIKLKKEELIMNKVIKKEKALPEITDEEIPFDIPETWEWVRLGELASITSGATPLKSNSKYYVDGNIPWCTSTVTGLEIVNEPNAYITDLALKECSLKVYPKGTLLMAMYGQGKTRGQVTELGIDSTINQACAAIELYNDTITTTGYIKIALKFVYNTIRQKAAGGAQPNLNQGKVKEILIPLPPVNEQVKIVAKYIKYQEQVRVLLSK